MLISNFIYNSADIIISYFSPTQSEMHEQWEIRQAALVLQRQIPSSAVAAKVTQLTVPFLRNAAFSVYCEGFKNFWKNTIWGAQTAAEEVLSQVMYYGRELDDLICMSDEDLANLDLDDTKQFIASALSTTRITFFDDALLNLVYPNLINIARNPLGRKMLMNLNHHLNEQGRFLAFFKGTDGDMAIYGPIFDTIKIDLVRPMFLMQTVDNWRYVDYLPIERSIFHECCHTLHEYLGPLDLTLSSWCWTNEEERITIAEENEYATAQGEPARLTHKNTLSLNEQTLFITAFQWGAHGTFVRLLNKRSFSWLNFNPQDQTLECLPHTLSKEDINQKATTLLHAFTTPPNPSSLTSALPADTTFVAETAEYKEYCFHYLKVYLYQNPHLRPLLQKLEELYAAHLATQSLRGTGSTRRVSF
jgi:hypothetical protein